MGGESARREFERRRQRDVARARAALPTAFALTVTSGVAVFLFVVFGAPMLFEALVPGAFNLTVRTRLMLGSFLAASAMISLGRAAWGPRRSTEAWRIGAEGEEATDRVLRPLEASGYRVLADVKLPGSAANVDHIVVGPTGVFVVETKNYAGPVTRRNGRLYNGRRPMDSVIAQVHRQVEAVNRVIDPLGYGQGLTRAIVCIHRASLRYSGRSTIQGVALEALADVVGIARASSPVPPFVE